MFWERLWKKKPLSVVLGEEHDEQLHRQLNLFDLLCIGIGGTVGTGIFATAGKIIQETAGSGAVFSWMIAGFACMINGFAYMELTSRLPSSGSCYAYAYHVLGEFPAYFAGALLTLEYAVSGAGVARTWAEKIRLGMETYNPEGNFEWMNYEYYNVFAFGIQAIAGIILLFGLNVGKKFVNIATVTKTIIVMIMIIGGCFYFQAETLSPMIPPRNQSERTFGWAGVATGATRAFFGYVGFDEVCCLAADAKSPRRTMPLAVIGVIIGTMILSALASFILSGMLPYDIEETLDFATAFHMNGAPLLSHLVRLGEIITMPVVVLVAFLAQPRLFYAMGRDNLLPKVFVLLDKNNNLFWNTLICCVVFSITALCVPFEHIWDLVDLGVLSSYIITNCCLIMYRLQYEPNTTDKLNEIMETKRKTCALYLLLFVITAGVSSFLLHIYFEFTQLNFLIIPAGVFTVLAFYLMYHMCRSYVAFTCARNQSKTIEPFPSADIFMVPCMPLLPCMAIYLNWYLIAQVAYEGLVCALLYALFAVASYFMYGYWNSAARKDWKISSTTISTAKNDDI